MLLLTFSTFPTFFVTHSYPASGGADELTMSQLLVEVCPIEEVKSHPNADKLEIAVVKGFQSVVPRGTYTRGEVVIYIPYDSVVPAAISDQFGFTGYLSNGRVKVAKLRGEPSYGVIVPNKWNYPLGENVAEKLGITKYVPPFRGESGGKNAAREEHPLFPRYTEIENLRHYPKAFTEGESVVISEKLHGTNFRCGMVNGELMVGSRRRQLKIPMRLKEIGWWEWLKTTVLRRPMPVEVNWDAIDGNDMHMFPLTLPRIVSLLQTFGQHSKQVVIFGEVFGRNVQKGMKYGSPDKLMFRVFDLLIDGKFIDYRLLEHWMANAGIEMVPILYKGPYSLDKVKELSKGKTTIGNDSHIREGVIVRPIAERHSPRLGRVVLKYVSDEFLTSKDIGDFEEE